MSRFFYRIPVAPLKNDFPLPFLPLRARMVASVGSVWLSRWVDFPSTLLRRRRGSGLFSAADWSAARCWFVSAFNGSWTTEGILQWRWNGSEPGRAATVWHRSEPEPLQWTMFYSCRRPLWQRVPWGPLGAKLLLQLLLWERRLLRPGGRRLRLCCRIPRHQLQEK